MKISNTKTFEAQDVIDLYNQYLMKRHFGLNIFHGKEGPKFLSENFTEKIKIYLIGNWFPIKKINWILIN